ncbi:DNA-binding MarR family transcriptional regulator [Streptomyces sp. 2333.5]|uniref:MarR family winged helix-turn-helix transcriptional regulator n=1 Tax=unclassified Streptomyces TaxID=2593676 RepID=UPI0008987F28|nr:MULTISPECIES: MarR family winged helix-turn-helix transcriptional regulator [unclassified Streptomyces]PJJ00193.1 DNA-binding MarR family transcriptional regulator [Streptomyces sp. 2333.5]SEB79740.1 DNA-binding transcriptional regulator, MarR family [Streptomyces sp. 2314.4]SEC66921.1 DNA-binding transcriptional regulator, MarR family [Streptomyces sp. 2112.2]
MKPIGYWLNRTDKALTCYMNDMLAEFGLTRIAWQVLNVIHDAPEVADIDVLSALTANADIATLTGAIDTVLAAGWADRPAPDRLALTPGGRQRLTDVAARVDAFRELSTTGISMDEYRTAVRVLERMSHNLEMATSAGH